MEKLNKYSIEVHYTQAVRSKHWQTVEVEAKDELEASDKAWNKINASADYDLEDEEITLLEENITPRCDKTIDMFAGDVHA